MGENSSELIPALKKVLQHLSAHPYPHVPTPQGCKKRASVAVIIRIRPAYTPAPAPDASTVNIEPPSSSSEPPPTLDDFFSRNWVQNGDPEILFIKRAGRAGDRWSGHVALPGGKRDLEDSSDVAAAIRETREEVGLELSASDCLQVGNLPERVVATTWGREALMVLCPYIFLYTGEHVPRVSPQPTEVASAHWVPLRALLSPNFRTSEYVDVAIRMARQGGPIVQSLLRVTLGRMVFSAIRLAPSESIFATSISGFIPEKGESHFERFLEGAFGIVPAEKKRGLAHGYLPLWGLTLGVMADFLDWLPPYNAVNLWRYPTFTVPDLRLLVWLFTRSLRQNNASDLSAGTWANLPANQTAVDSATTAVAVTEAEPNKLIESMRNEVGISGLGIGSHTKDAVSRLLVGYYDRIDVAVGVFVAYRSVLGSAAIYWLYRLWLKKRS